MSATPSQAVREWLHRSAVARLRWLETLSPETHDVLARLCGELHVPSLDVSVADSGRVVAMCLACGTWLVMPSGARNVDEIVL